MKKYKFYNETFEFDFCFVVFDYSKVKEYNKVMALLEKSGLIKKDAIELLQQTNGCFVGGKPYYVIIDTNEFKLSTINGVIDMLKAVQHECGHVRGCTLRHMNEKIKKVDRESHLRISDWAYKKCLSTKFMKQFLKVKK